MWLLFLVGHKKHAEDYMCICTIIAMVQAYKCTVMLETSTYINTSSAITDCFPETMVTLDVGSINDHFIMLVSALFTGLTLKTMPSLCMYCVCTLYA